MPKTKRVLCKFFAHGACFKGENCEFSHDWKDPPNNICTYYQKGICSYGSQCRYEHVKASQTDLSASSSSTKPRQFGVSGSAPLGKQDILSWIDMRSDVLGSLEQVANLVELPILPSLWLQAELRKGGARCNKCARKPSKCYAPSKGSKPPEQAADEKYIRVIAASECESSVLALSWGIRKLAAGQFPPSVLNGVVNTGIKCGCANHVASYLYFCHSQVVHYWYSTSQRKGKESSIRG
ncbi:hypothetical protein GOBAR_DD20743 [Gossypium barbadense]|nr:hypothetical protein GOBAR_DD20743 [Gossypium barbadense]